MQKENKTLNLPEKLENNNNDKKRSKFFSIPVFKESIKSNWLGTLIVSIANGLILIVVMIIMSGLNIGSTSSSLDSLIENADLESTLKESSIGYYSSYYNGALTFETIEQSRDAIISNSSLIYESVTNESVTSILPSIRNAYDLIYLLNNNQESAKQQTLTIANGLIDTSTSISEEDKPIYKEIVSLYLDEYINALNNGLEINDEDLFLNTVSQYLINAVSSSTNLNEEYIDEFKQEVISNLENYILSVENIRDEQEILSLQQDYGYELFFTIIKYASADYSYELTSLLSDKLKLSYTINKTSFIENTDNYRYEEISEALIEMFQIYFEDIMYYSYLPNFDVEILTNELGYPIYYEYDENNQKVEVTLYEYDPDKFIYLSSTSASSSTILEKMHKEIITGEGYSQEEINQAKLDAEEGIDIILSYFESFMQDFITRDQNNTNLYFDGTNLIQNTIIDKALSDFEIEADKTILKQFNETYGTDFKEVLDITGEYMGMDGKELKRSIRSYEISAVYSYIDAYNTLLKENDINNYTQQECFMVALSIASKTVVSSLPDSLTSLISQLGSTDLYGLIVGVFMFGAVIVLLPLVYTIILANSLVSEKIETGSLAFTLSTPIKRSTYVTTQAIYLVLSELFIGIITLIFGLIAREIGVAIGGTQLMNSLPISDVLLYSLGSTITMISLSSICFLSSCIFNKTRLSITVGGGINIFFFICSILSFFGSEALTPTIRIEAMGYFRYFTIMSLNNGVCVMNGNLTLFSIELICLLLISVGCYIGGIVIFNKKDLPL